LINIIYNFSYSYYKQHSLVVQILLEINALNYNQVLMATMAENMIATGEDGALINISQPTIMNKISLIDEVKE